MRGILLLALALAMMNAQAAVIGENVEYHVEDDVMLKGYLAFDDAVKGKRPGVLVVHEWWGHNQYARDRANMLAELGYVALAVDMYGEGKQASHPEEAQQFSSEIAKNMPLGRARFQAAMARLQAHPQTDATRIAAIGYCFGGAVVLQMARDGLDLDAVVSFHGSLGTQQPARKGETKAKIFVAHGAADPFVKPEEIIAFMAEMNDAGADYTFTAYGGALHSFTNPEADKFGEKFKLPLKYSKRADFASWRDMQIVFNDVFK